jgi:hypothetical protein
MTNAPEGADRDPRAPWHERPANGPYCKLCGDDYAVSERQILGMSWPIFLCHPCWLQEIGARPGPSQVPQFQFSTPNTYPL